MNTRIFLYLGLLLMAPLLSKSQNQAYIDSLTQHIQQLRKEGAHDTLIANDLNRLSFSYWGINPSLAEKYAKEMLELSEKHQYLRGIARSYVAFGVVCDDTGNYQQSIRWYEQAADIRRKAGLIGGVADCYNNAAIVYTRMGQLPKSLEAYINALKIYEKIGDSAGIGRSYGNMGLAYHALHKYEEALRLQKKALAIRKVLKDEQGIGMAYANIGNAYSGLNKPVEAVKNLLEAIPHYEAVGDLSSLGNNYNILGFHYYSKGEYANAKRYYLKARELFQQTENKYGMGETTINIGNTLVKFADYPQGAKYLQEGIALAKEIQSFELMKAAYEGLSTLDSLKGDYKGAFRNYQLFIAMRDSMLNKENTEKTVQMRMEYEFDKERELSTQQQEAELQSRNLILLSLGLGLTLMGVIAILLYRRSVFTKKVQVQTQRNLEEKEVLLREIHHRVKNNLAVISGLLYLQKNRVDDETIKGVLLEGQNRIDSMVLVHEMLYQSNNIAEIDLKSYLEKLIGQIAAGFEGKNYFYSIKGSTTLEPKQAVPLGLILTELITNIYKYAYPDQTKGEFSVQIEPMNEARLKIILQDRGKGLPANFDPAKSKTLGLKLVNLLCQQMNANISFDADNGTKVLLYFTVKKEPKL